MSGGTHIDRPDRNQDRARIAKRLKRTRERKPSAITEESQ
jgi:hypothetical protein